MIQTHLEAASPLSLVYAIPDHPWVDDAAGADVRIAMTVGVPGRAEGVLERIVREEEKTEGGSRVTLTRLRGPINADLTVGVDVTKAVSLQANQGLSCPGVKLHGSGFIVTPQEANALGLGRISGLERHIRPYLNGRDLNQRSRGLMVIDLFGLSVDHVQSRFPEVYQWILNRVKPEREAKAAGGTRDSMQYARQWWLFGKTRNEFRPALSGLERYTATTETSRHRFFVFLDASILSDNKLITIALDDGFYLGVLSSRLHVAYSIATGGWLGVGNDSVYVKTRCFETFPFPACAEAHKERIRALAESLDNHRKRQQSQFSALSITDMYNVIAKIRSEEPLNSKDKLVHEQGIVSVLKQLHDDLDAAVFDAYGWPQDLSDDEILRRLVDLNRERAEEEKRGIIRWLRPEYQNPNGAQAASTTQGACRSSRNHAKHLQPSQVQNAPGPRHCPSRPRPSAPCSPSSRPA